MPMQHPAPLCTYMVCTSVHLHLHGVQAHMCTPWCAASCRPVPACVSRLAPGASALFVRRRRRRRRRRQVLTALAASGRVGAGVLVGPEGGFTGAELEAVRGRRGGGVRGGGGEDTGGERGGGGGRW
jgi:uncharacterized membrane protein YgcG